ncbi:TetR/AcrR family transcriptional regulator, partial [Mesorhizobium japonicum]
LAQHAPPEALRRWMDRFAERMAGKRAMSEALRSVMKSEGRGAATRRRMTDALRGILEAGAADGSLRHDVDAGDLIAALVGITVSAGDDPTRIGRLMDILARGASTSN